MIDFTCGDLNYTFSPYESNRVRVTGLVFKILFHSTDAGNSYDKTHFVTNFRRQHRCDIV